MSIQYIVPGFELMTFGTSVSSHNNQTGAPARLLDKLNRSPSVRQRDQLLLEHNLLLRSFKNSPHWS